MCAFSPQCRAHLFSKLSILSPACDTPRQTKVVWFEEEKNVIEEEEPEIDRPTKQMEKLLLDTRPNASLNLERQSFSRPGAHAQLELSKINKKSHVDLLFKFVLKRESDLSEFLFRANFFF